MLEAIAAVSYTSHVHPKWLYVLSKQEPHKRCDHRDPTSASNTRMSGSPRNRLLASLLSACSARVGEKSCRTQNSNF